MPDFVEKKPDNRIQEFEKTGCECERIEDVLRESEEKFRLLAENLRDIVFIQDMNFKIIYSSPATEELFGYSVDEAKGLDKLEYMTAESYQKAMGLFKKYVSIAQRDASFQIPLMEFEYVRKDGTMFIGEMKVKFIRDSGGALIGSIGIIRDITERKYLEEQLEIRQRMDSLGTLAGGIAHDFNNILTGIIGNLDLLRSESENFTVSQAKYLANAMRSCEIAASLVGQFQTLSGSTSGEKKAVDIYEVMDDVFKVLKKTTDKLIEKRIEFCPKQFFVHSDPSALHQVFMNLGTNAVQAIEERGTKEGDFISVQAENYRATGRDKTGLRRGDYVHIMFEDNGMGMTDEVKRRAFEPLFTTKGKGPQKGQGLGLAMVYNIVTRNHGGYITIQSEEQNGTIFHFYLPKAQSGVSGGPEEPEEVCQGYETVLIIEDEDTVMEYAERVLSEYGYTILTANDGKKGLDVYRENRKAVDLVLLDLTMPEMSGRTVFEKILEIDPHARIIISSGHSDEEARSGILSKAGGYIKKPYTIKQLVRVVRSVLDS